jgi:hypothetical protein
VPEHDVSERRGVDLVALLFGLGALLFSGYALSGGEYFDEAIDLRWLLAGGAVVVGLLLLISSLVRKRS